jgi:hypothetical protein
MSPKLTDTAVCCRPTRIVLMMSAAKLDADGRQNPTEMSNSKVSDSGCFI